MAGRVQPAGDRKPQRCEAAPAREYLDRYFYIVCAKPQMDRFRITLVDAFCGGGLFTRKGKIVWARHS